MAVQRAVSVLCHCAHLLAMAGATVEDALARNVEKLDARFPDGLRRSPAAASGREGGLTCRSTPTPRSQLVNFLILQRVESLPVAPSATTDARASRCGPTSSGSSSTSSCRDRQPWIKPETLPEVRLKADGTVEMEWCYGDRTAPGPRPLQRRRHLREGRHEGGGNTVVRVRLNPELLEDEDEARAAFRWLEDE
jgi:hypothetical protein